jgi:CDGSH iron-sulfur domain-containing protein 3
MAEVNVTIFDNGPLKVDGGVTITDGAGKTYPAKDTVFICRCGQSANKPFCDGTHKTANFASAPRA